MGISTYQSYCGAQIFEAVGLAEGVRRQVLHRHGEQRRGHRPVRGRRGSGAPAPRRRSATTRCCATCSTPAASTCTACAARRTCGRRNRSPSCSTRRAPTAHATYQDYAKLINEQSRELKTFRGLFEFKTARAHAGADRGSRARQGHRQALRDRRDEPRLDLDRGAHHARGRDEPHRRQVEHGRRRRGRGALPRRIAHGQESRGQGRYACVACSAAIASKCDVPLHAGRQPAQQDQAGRVGTLRRHRRVPVVGRPDPDQDGAGRQARRRRPAARPQGVGVHRQAALLGAGRGPDLAAAAPRHLLDRGPGAAHPRSQERESEGVDLGQARVRSRRRHRRGGRRQSEVRSRDHRRPRRRHGRIAASRRSSTRARRGSSASRRRSRRSC